ncbi:MAG: TnpV protein [Clostridia bacterium]|nr:TnpV protein [Clostridia bacterium]
MCYDTYATSKLKGDNQMAWVTRMNNIHSRATEIVNHEIIYN